MDPLKATGAISPAAGPALGVPPAGHGVNAAFVELSALVRHPQIACRSVDEANAEPVLEASEAFTHDGKRHVHFATGCGKTSHLDDAREDGHIEKAIDHGGPPFPKQGKSLYTNSRSGRTKYPPTPAPRGAPP